MRPCRFRLPDGDSSYSRGSRCSSNVRYIDWICSYGRILFFSSGWFVGFKKLLNQSSFLSSFFWNRRETSSFSQLLLFTFVRKFGFCFLVLRTIISATAVATFFFSLFFSFPYSWGFILKLGMSSWWSWLSWQPSHLSKETES